MKVTCSHNHRLRVTKYCSNPSFKPKRKYFCPINREGHRRSLPPPLPSPVSHPPLLAVRVSRRWDTKECLDTGDNGPSWTWDTEGQQWHNDRKSPNGGFQNKRQNTKNTNTDNEQRQETCSSKTHTVRSIYVKRETVVKLVQSVVNTKTNVSWSEFRGRGMTYLLLFIYSPAGILVGRKRSFHIDGVLVVFHGAVAQCHLKRRRKCLNIFSRTDL